MINDRFYSWREHEEEEERKEEAFRKHLKFIKEELKRNQKIK